MSKAILTGYITDIFPAEIRGAFEKRVIWITEEAEHNPNSWAIEFQQGDANKVDDFKLKIGDKITVTVEIRGFKYKKNGQSNIIQTLKYLDLQKINNTASTSYSR